MMSLFPPPRSFGSKVTLLVTVTTGLAVLLVCAVLVTVDYVNAKAETAELAIAQASIVAVNSEAPLTFGDPALGTEALGALRASPNVAAAFLYDLEGAVFAEYVNPKIEAPPIPRQRLGRHAQGRWLTVTREIAGPAGSVGRLQVVFDMSGAQARAWSNAAFSIAVAALTTLVAFLVAIRLKAFLVKPVAELASTARHVSETKDYGVRATKYGEDELGQFTDVFNEMLEQIQQQDLELQRAYAQRERLLESERVARSELEQASQVKDEFVATLSHELRTPLSAILGWAHMLRTSDRPADQLAKGMEVIERNARVQTQIIEDLLDMSRIISGKIRLDVQPTSLAEAIEAAVGTVRPAAEAKGIRLQTVLDSSVGPVRGDSNRLQQVVWNLLSNAIKFTPRGGRVQVALERVNSHVEITVSDTGQGIKPEFLPYVFDRFRQADSSTTRRHAGLGLGLAIVKQLVELHGGTVRAKSAGEGQGATFSIELPLMPVRDEAAEARAHPRASSAAVAFETPLSLAGVKVLVVDDEPDARELVGELLESCGAIAVCAGSANEALALFRTFRPDVLVSDIGMPGTDGYDLIKSIRAMEDGSGATTPAVALTAFARSEDRTRAMLAGYQMHLAKPVEPAELLATVASVANLTGSTRH